MQEFRDYDIALPELVYDIINYFRVSNNIKKIAEKSIIDYCNTSRFNLSKEINYEQLQPDAVHLICDNLVKKGILNCLKVGTGALSWDTNYIFSPQDDALFLSKDPTLVFRLNCMAYGFRYICAEYKKYVLPIIIRDSKGNIAMGTCFRFKTGILTAKHCLNAVEVQIIGYESKHLRKCPILISDEEDIDVAYIELNEDSVIIPSEAHVLEEVLVMGYPKIPMFSDFCAAERASISAIPTRGAIAAYANQYLSKKIGQLMLITARIRGGNSGGPIIDSNGAVVGIAFAEPTSKGEYDEMGYGIAYPIDIFDKVYHSQKNMRVNFVDNLQ